MLTAVNTVNNTESGAAVTPTRRERLRAATEAEILATARTLWVQGGPAATTLREVGRRMGMTASALYRYVDGHDDLMDALVASLLDELTEQVRAGAERAGLRGTCRAFRDWAVANRPEFTLVFAGPDLSRHDAGHDRTSAAFVRFGGVFGDAIAAVVGVEAAVRQIADPSDKLAAMPPAAQEAYVRGWTRLLGTVSVEVFGHTDWTGRDPSEAFEREMADVLGWLPEQPPVGVRSPGTDA